MRKGLSQPSSARQKFRDKCLSSCRYLVLLVEPFRPCSPPPSTRNTSRRIVCPGFWCSRDRGVRCRPVVLRQAAGVVDGPPVADGLLEDSPVLRGHDDFFPVGYVCVCVRISVCVLRMHRMRLSSCFPFAVYAAVLSPCCGVRVWADGRTALVVCLGCGWYWRSLGYRSDWIRFPPTTCSLSLPMSRGSVVALCSRLFPSD